MKSDKELREIREKIMELNDRFQEMGGDADEEMGDKLKAFKDVFTDRSRQMWNQARNKGQKVDSYIHENPWQAAAGAFLVGCVVGMIASKRGR